MSTNKNNKKSIPDDIAESIEEDMIFGYEDEDGNKQYPTLKSSAEWYEVSYDVLRQLAKSWQWRQRRKDHRKEVSQKVEEKKKSERLCDEKSESESEAIVMDDFRFNKAANKLRRATSIEIDKIINGKVYLYSLKDGTPIYGTPKNAAYLLMNLGKALESAQKISKTAVGEPSEIIKTESNVKSEGRYTVTERLICSQEHINHEVEVLNAASKAQGCNK
jgi:hypothetical protein